MEKNIFDWDGWDQHDTMAFSFTDVTLKVPVGEFPAGTKFPFANVDYENGTMEFCEEDDTCHQFRMNLSLVAVEK